MAIIVAFSKRVTTHSSIALVVAIRSGWPLRSEIGKLGLPRWTSLSPVVPTHRLGGGRILLNYNKKIEEKFSFALKPNENRKLQGKAAMTRMWPTKESWPQTQPD